MPRLERGLRADGHLFRRARIRSEESGDVRARVGGSAASSRVRTPYVRALRRRKGMAGRAAKTSRRASKWRRGRGRGDFPSRRRQQAQRAGETSTRRALSTLNNGRTLLALPLRSARWRHPSGRRGRAARNSVDSSEWQALCDLEAELEAELAGRSRGPLNARDEKAPSGMSPLPLGFRRGSPRERRHARGHRGGPASSRSSPTASPSPGYRLRRQPHPSWAPSASQTPRPPHPRAPTEAARGARAGRRNWGSCSTGSGVPCSRWPPPRH